MYKPPIIINTGHQVPNDRSSRKINAIKIIDPAVTRAFKVAEPKPSR